MRQRRKCRDINFFLFLLRFASTHSSLSLSLVFVFFLLKVTSEEVVRAYIERIKEVNPLINAVVEDRFQEAIEDAKRADKLVQTTPTYLLITNYPILGVPFTVKESCSLKGKYLYPKKTHKTAKNVLRTHTNARTRAYRYFAVV